MYCMTFTEYLLCQTIFFFIEVLILFHYRRRIHSKLKRKHIVFVTQRNMLSVQHRRYTFKKQLIGLIFIALNFLHSVPNTSQNTIKPHCRYWSWTCMKCLYSCRKPIILTLLLTGNSFNDNYSIYDTIALIGSNLRHQKSYGMKFVIRKGSIDIYRITE